MDTARELKDTFKSLFGEPARVFRAPGRVNLIGEHTDYNDGFVMPAAIGFSTWVAVSRRNDRKLVVRSLNFDEQREFDLDADPQPQRDWTDYVIGEWQMLERAGHRISGANLLIRGDVPIGSGLSSSAAIEVSTGLALMSITGHAVDRVELARLSQRAENEFVGARCGIMDQFVSGSAQEGKALLLDCRSLDYRLLPLPDDVSLVICNTMVKHDLATGEYNARRAECEDAVRRLSAHKPEIRALRDVTLDELREFSEELPPVVFKRSHHVITENARVLDAADALERGALERFGQLMYESHASLRDDYEVSCPELDAMVEAARPLPGVYGARMTGGGFGGCTVNLVQSTEAENFKQSVAGRYKSVTGIQPTIYICSAAAGAGEVT